ncbi:MAG: bacteriohemerythrin [bacterium]|nr:bacteriohemerythrin [bacterium]
MAIIQWSDRFSVKIQQIDNQHKKWVDIINRLHDAMVGGKGADVIGSVLLEVVNYGKMHLDYEEQLMAKYGYPDLAAHKFEHDVLKKKIADLHAKFQAGNKFLTLDVMNMLKDWLMQHIEGVDKKYTEHFLAKGLS